MTARRRDPAIFRDPQSRQSATSFLEHLRTSLRKLPERPSFHILNGILFENFFDSRGLRRKVAKADYIDEAFALEEDEARKEFIQQRLQPYHDSPFYFPSSLAEDSVDVVVGRFSDKLTVTKMCFEGENVLYNDDGDGYLELSDDISLQKDTVGSFRTRLARAQSCRRSGSR